MKRFFLKIAALLICHHGLLLAQTGPLPPEVAALIADFKQEYGKAVEPANKVLQQEASKIAARLVADGHEEEAKLVASQVEEKMQGKEVKEPHSALLTLFKLYDNAILVAAKPIREKYGKRVDGMLQAFAGKDMKVVLALGEAKRVVEGSPAPASQTPSAAPKPKATPQSEPPPAFSFLGQWEISHPSTD